MADILSQVRGIWSRLDGGQKLSIAAVMLATVVGLGSIIWFAGRPDFQTVFTSGEPHEVMQAANALDKGSVPYRIEGSSLVVESTRIEQAHRALSTAGLGSGVIGGSDIASMTSDRETKRHALARQLEATLVQKLEDLAGVVRAQVSHSKPKRSPYRSMDVETQPRASVGLKLSAGASFRSVARAAVVHTAAALGMPPEYVTVTNLANMATYSEAAEGEAALDTSDFLAQERARSEEKTQVAQAILDRIYPDKAMVRVTVSLDPDWQVSKERSAPDKPIVKRTMTTKDETTQPGRSPSGDPSPAANPIGTAAAAASGPTQKKEIKETEYDSSSFKEVSIGKLAPDIRSMTVAVVIDESLVPDAAKEAEIESLVKNSIGWSSEWGDDNAFTIHKTTIPDIEFAEPASVAGVLPMVERYGPMVGQVIAVILVLLFLRGLLKKSAPAPRSAKGSATSVAAAGATGGVSAIIDDELPPEELSVKMRREIEEAINTDPGAVSRLLESWITEVKS